MIESPLKFKIILSIFPSKIIKQADSPLDQNKLIRTHPLQILPPMPIRTLHSPRLTLSFGINQPLRFKILLQIDRTEITQCEWAIESWMTDRTPEVDYLISFLGAEGSFGCGEVAVDAGEGCCGCLVDVD